MATKESELLFLRLIYYMAMLIGALVFGNFIYGLFMFIYRHFFKRSLDLPMRYGRGSWALVTGAGDGIGAEFCKQLAELGFNIVLVSRTKSKMLKVAEDYCSQVKTRIIEADFTGKTKPDFYT